MPRIKKNHPASFCPKPAANISSPSIGLIISPKRFSGWRRAILRGLLVIIAPAALFALCDIVLRLIGFGCPTSFLLRDNRGDFYVQNDRFACQFYGPKTTLRPVPLKIAALKPENTLRIIVLDESAAAGTPDPSYGFSRILEVILHKQFPKQHIEVLNAAMRGVNSHIILLIAKDCARIKPNLFIVYMGNNEVIGLHAPNPDSNRWTIPLRLLQLAQWFKATRTGQLVQSLFSHWTLESELENTHQDMAFFRAHRLTWEDPKRQVVYARYRSNLDDLCQLAHAAGAKVLLSTLSVNLKDFPPLASLHRNDLSPKDLESWGTFLAEGSNAESSGRLTDAVKYYVQALRIDDHFAERHFRVARCYWSAGQFDLARSHFGLARDWDALQVRADSKINEIIRQVALQRKAQGISLVDAEKALSESEACNHQIPDLRLFYEYVHFRWEGDYQMARALWPPVIDALGMPPPRIDPPSKEECAQALGYNLINELQMEDAILQLTSRPPFLDQLDHAQRQAAAVRDYERRAAAITQQDLRLSLELCRRASARNPADWWLHYNYGMLFQTAQDFAKSAEELEKAVLQMPHLPPLRMALAEALEKTGRRDAAASQIQEVLHLDPHYPTANQMLAKLTGARK